MSFPADFCGPMLAAIGAPNDAQNQANLNGWNSQEKTGLHPAPPPESYDWNQWNNPLNTTQPWPGAIDSGAQPGPHDVKIYQTLADGCGATATTLLNGLYPNIVAALRASSPASQWNASARHELDKWGTGAIWCDYVQEVSDMLDPKDPIVIELRNRIDAIFEGLHPAGSATLWPSGAQIQADIAAAAGKPPTVAGTFTVSGTVSGGGTVSQP